MKAFITPAYTFTPGASGVGTVNLSGIASFDVKKLAAIINQTKGVTIYATGSIPLRYTNVVSTTLTLFADTTGMSSGDNLQVIYEDPSGIPVTISGVATAANQTLIKDNIGDVGEPAPSSDTAASGLNGRLQRIAQTLTLIKGLFPTTLGQKTAANSFATVPASDYVPPAAAVPVAGTITNGVRPVGTTASRLTASGSAPSATRRKMQFTIEIPTSGSPNFYVGGSGVTNSSPTLGVQVFPGTLYTYDNDAGDYYIVSDTAGQIVYVLEQA